MRRALSLTLAIAALSVPCFGATTDVAQVESAHKAILERIEAVRRFVGYDVANDIIVRLDDDLAYRDADMPSDLTAAEWNETVADVLRLDVELVDQVVAGTPQPLGEVRGLHENFVRMRDGTYQPMAVFVPSHFDPAKLHPLIVALHGRPQSESQLLAQPVLRSFAEASGAIVVAPWGRGNYDFAEPAASEVYDAVDAVERAFSIDRRKVYLVGYSMGGFAVFRVAPLHAERWAGIMSISGAILNSEVRAYVTACRNVNLYIVNGGEDLSIPPKYGEQTAAFLRHAGLAVGFYQEPHGTHALRTLGHVIGLAWNDMFAGRAERDLERPIEPGRSGSGGPNHPA